MRRIPLTAAIAALALAAGPALAEEGEDGSDPDEKTIEDSAILPSAEGHLESRAPTMDVDCEAEPDECMEDLDGPSVGPELSTGDDPDTPEVESEAGDPVVAEPEDG